MQIRPLTIAGAWHFLPTQHADERGAFLEAYNETSFREAVGQPFTLAQTNSSVSKAGALRGVHFSDVPPGQAKYVMCPSGAVWDVVVDVRVGSPTYGQWDAVQLDDTERGAVYIAEGLGHGFLALTENATVVYNCSTGYAPGREHGFHPLDPDLAIPWPRTRLDGAPLELILSAKDQQLPTLAQAAASGVLPSFEDVTSYYGTLRDT